MDVQLTMQSVLITTNYLSSNPAQGEVYLMQHYVIGLWLSAGRWFSPPLNCPPRYNWYIVESGAKHHNPYPWYIRSAISTMLAILLFSFKIISYYISIFDWLIDYCWT